MIKGGVKLAFGEGYNNMVPRHKLSVILLAGGSELHEFLN
jgi:hypothetical protein